MKTKIIYVCENCGYQTSKWIGRCPSCEAWNSFRENIKEPESRFHKGLKGSPAKTETINKEIPDSNRFSTGINEFDRVLGGGIVQGSLILLAGEPGIGKSTITLQLCENLSAQGKRILYIAGEESCEQISMRAKRLSLELKNLSLISETSIETILATIDRESPNFVIVDSIQVVYSEQIPATPGTISQVRTCTEGIMELIKKLKIPTLLIGHVTKDGLLAGPRALEHLVDAVLYIEGDRYQNFRILRGIKNRFGSTDEVGIFEMAENGMREVKNPSALFLSDTKEPKIGSIITVTMEGTRPILIEVQALTNPTNFGYPKRTASGIDINRLNLLLAALQKHTGVNLQNQDVYVNVTSGFRLQEPACDLAVLLAILSSFYKKPLPINLAAIGEVGLSGEIRNVSQLDKRLKEAKKLGFAKIANPENIKKISELKAYF